ncbi:MAG: propionate CoA-transferase [Clostridiales bacterium]|jgi:propionate CoA-transferase|nr:propionate CoA-transferase [Clostridiales bacterium]
MFHIVTADEAIGLIRDGDRIGINSFLALSNPETLHDALTRKVRKGAGPRHLKLFCAAGFGAWDASRFAEPYVAAGAVDEVVAGHFGSMPEVTRLAAEGGIEAYNLPLGVLSHAIRAAAAGQVGLLSEVGLNLFVDPRVGTPALNSVSERELVSLVTVAGREYLFYEAPKLDVAFIKGTTVDPNGNITFEKEYLTVDALALAQAVKANGGKVVVQVDRVSHMFSRPRNVIVPGILVDAVVVDERREERERVGLGDYNPTLSGDIHVPASHMDYYMGRLTAAGRMSGRSGGDRSAEIIGERAARELAPGQIVNIGIGIPEMAGTYASKLGILKDIVTTVEAGGIGGLPAPGGAFGATIGADMIIDMASQFDYYDGGGLDICFLGGLEADRHGNVNAHRLRDKFIGIGGFANITNRTKIIVFCLTFTAKGLAAEWEAAPGYADEAGAAGGAGYAGGTGGTRKVLIRSEGRIPKFRDKIGAISFSAKNALQKGQRVLYITERCVFELTPGGLRLAEVYGGIDRRTQIDPFLNFPV